MSTCRSCHAEIIWAVTTHGKRMPLDVKPVIGFQLDGDVDSDPIATSAKVYVSHFVTCPNAEKHRRKP